MSITKEIRERVRRGESLVREEFLYTSKIIIPTHHTTMLAGVAQVELNNGTKHWVYTNRTRSKRYKVHIYKVVRYPSLTLIGLIANR